MAYERKSDIEAFAETIQDGPYAIDYLHPTTGDDRPMEVEAAGASKQVRSNPATPRKSASWSENVSAYVYVLEGRGRCKIGVSGSPEKRRKALLHEYPDLSAVAFCMKLTQRDAFLVEAKAHDLLIKHRIPRSELFRVTPALATSIIRQVIGALGINETNLKQKSVADTAPLSLRIPDEIKAALARASAAEERPITTIILRLLRTYLQEGGHLPEPPPRKRPR